MKNKLQAIIAIATLAISPVGLAKEDHAHEKKVAGPNGGRVITSVDPHFEFLVTPDKKVKITFLDEAGKPVAPKEQTVSAVGGERANPTKLAFTKDGESLISDKALPDGNTIPIVLLVKASPDAKAVTEKFGVNLADCAECKHKEYACTCEHGEEKGGDHDGHSH